MIKSCAECGVVHGTTVLRSSKDSRRWLEFNEGEWSYEMPDGHTIRMSEIPDEFDIADGKHVEVRVGSYGGRLLCQRCGLASERAIGRKTRKARVVPAGQMEMF